VTATAEWTYPRLWSGIGRNLGFALATLPVVVVASVMLWIGVLLGAGLAVVRVGIPIVVAALLTARWFGSVELARLAAAGRPPIVRAVWRAPSTPGVTGRLRSVVTDGRYWVQALHGIVVNPILGVFTWSITFSWVVVAVGGSSYWFWGHWVESASHLRSAGWAGCGVAAALTLPYIVHAVTVVHDFVARRMLGEWRVPGLRRAAAEAEASRESAVLAEDRALRRLERDIHDGPQQGLLRIQYDLSSAGRMLQPGDAALPLVEGALQLAKDTLVELRELSQGLAPPLLQDRGLIAAVRALAARSEIPTTTTIAFSDDPGIPAVERSVYFIVSELLSNAAKHSGARSARIDLALSADTSGRRTLIVDFGDDGIGGALQPRGHGLEGLSQRAAGLGGTFTVDSPAGGPSRFVATIPLR
jgi:signal transduction histidine kinase